MFSVFQGIDPNPGPLLFHHAASLAGLLHGVFVPVSGAELLAAMSCLEVTNPLVHTMWLMKDAGLADTRAYRAVRWSFFALFVVARGAVGPVLTAHVLPSPRVSLIVKAAAVALQGVSLAWLVLVVKKFYREIITGAPGCPGKQRVE
jgi:hypothetical protein